MNTPSTQESLVVTLADARRVQASFLAAADGPRGRTSRNNRVTTTRFIDHMSDAPPAPADRLLLSADRLMLWMIQDCRGRTVPYAVCRMGIVKRYLRALNVSGLTATNLMEDFRSAHRRAPWHALVRALQSDRPAAALQAMASPPAWSTAGRLHEHVQRYVETHESLGKGYRSQRQALGDLHRNLRAWDIAAPQAVDAGMIRRWLDALTCNPHTRRQKARYVRRFFDYLAVMRVVPRNPLGPARFVEARPGPRTFRPFIFTTEQVASLLADVARRPASHSFPLRGATCHLMLALLYTLGLRHGEARRLRIGDVDLDRQTLLIAQTKFHKTRLTPFGPKLGQRLRAYLDQRRRLFRVCHDDERCSSPVTANR